MNDRPYEECSTCRNYFDEEEMIRDEKHDKIIRCESCDYKYGQRYIARKAREALIKAFEQPIVIP